MKDRHLIHRQGMCQIALIGIHGFIKMYTHIHITYYKECEYAEYIKYHGSSKEDFLQFVFCTCRIAVTIHGNAAEDCDK